MSSKSMASPRLASVSSRLMMTAMAASSLLRFPRPATPTPSRSSWELPSGEKERWTEKRLLKNKAAFWHVHLLLD